MDASTGSTVSRPLPPVPQGPVVCPLSGLTTSPGAAGLGGASLWHNSGWNGGNP